MENLKASTAKSISDLVRESTGKATGCTFDFEYVDLLEEVAEAAIDDYFNSPSDTDEDESEIVYNCVFEAVDNKLIYYKDQWTLLHHFFNPEDCDLHEAVQLFTDDASTVVFDVIDELWKEDANND